MRNRHSQSQPQEVPNAAGGGDGPRPPWRQPVVTLLSCDKTLVNPGSVTDGGEGTGPPT